MDYLMLFFILRHCGHVLFEAGKEELLFALDNFIFFVIEAMRLWNEDPPR